MIMTVTAIEREIIFKRREAIKELRADYEERLKMYYDGLTHRGDVIARRAVLINLGEDVPELLY